MDINLHKRESFETLLDRGVVMLHLDPRCDGVAVPERFTGEPTLRLNISYSFELPALDIDEEGIYAELSFSGRRFGCRLPWKSIFAMTLLEHGHEGVLWPGSLPKEAEDFLAVTSQTVPDDVEFVVLGPPHEEESDLARPALQVIEGGGEAPPEHDETQRPNLRVVGDDDEG